MFVKAEVHSDRNVVSLVGPLHVTKDCVTLRDYPGKVVELRDGSWRTRQAESPADFLTACEHCAPAPAVDETSPAADDATHSDGGITTPTDPHSDSGPRKKR